MPKHRTYTDKEYHTYFELVVSKLLETYDCKLIYPKDPTNRLDMEDGIVLRFPKVNFEYKISNFMVYSMMGVHLKSSWGTQEVVELVDKAYLRTIKK